MNQHSISGRLAQAVEHDKAGEYRKISRELRPVEEKLGNEVLTGKKPVADPEQEGTGEGENKPDDPDAAWKVFKVKIVDSNLLKMQCNQKRQVVWTEHNEHHILFKILVKQTALFISQSRAIF